MNCSIITCQKVVIVTGTEYIKSLSRDQLWQLYKGDLQKVAGGNISFLDHERDTQVYKDFIRQYFNKSAEEMKQFWVKQKLESGKRAPKFLPAGFLPKALASIKGSISYYYEGNVPENISVVKIIN